MGKKIAPDLRLTVPLIEQRNLEKERPQALRITNADLGLTDDDVRSALYRAERGNFGPATEIIRRFEMANSLLPAPRCLARTKKGKLCNMRAAEGQQLCTRHRRERVRAIQETIAEKKAAGRKPIRIKRNDGSR